MDPPPREAMEGKLRMDAKKVLCTGKWRFMRGHGARLGYRPRPSDEQELIPTVMQELSPTVVCLLAFASIRVSYSCPFVVSVRGEKGGTGLGDRGREGGSVSRCRGSVLG
jgi:hypothetical protein